MSWQMVGRSVKPLAGNVLDGDGAYALLLQGWIPAVATFLNTPAWTMSAESFYYVLFPWLAA